VGGRHHREAAPDGPWCVLCGADSETPQELRGRFISIPVVLPGIVTGPGAPRTAVRAIDESCFAAVLRVAGVDDPGAVAEQAAERNGDCQWP
jgi:hypothetical protein